MRYLDDYSLNQVEKLLIIIVLVLSIVIGSQIGIIYKLYDSDNISPNSNSIINNNYSVQSIPSEFISANKTTTKIQYEFNRAENNKIFDYRTHDPMVIEENNTSYLIVGSEETQKLYKNDNVTDSKSWTLVDGNYLRSIFEADDVVQTDNRTTIYTSSSVYTTTQPITKDNWTRENNSYISKNSDIYYDSFGDSGVYYDDINNTYHLYYEKGSKADFSGVAIGHAVSNNGINNWSIYPEVWNSSGSEYGVGDFDIIEKNNTIIIFGDYDKKHPKYSVAVWTNNNPYTEFDKADEFAISPRNSSDSYDDNYGVGDPEVVNIHNDEYIMFANGYKNSSNIAKLHYYNGIIKSNG